MDQLERCPECRSPEIHEVERFNSLHGVIRAMVCRACDWSTDLRVGRPAADRSKNLGLRRRLRTDVGGTSEQTGTG
jgi:hypothetical protein